MFCSECGASVNDGVKFCVECGAAQLNSEQPVNNPKTDDSLTSNITSTSVDDPLAYFKAIGAIIVVIVVCVILSNKEPEQDFPAAEVAPPADTAQLEQRNQVESGSYEKIDSGIVAMKYSSNPFEIRKLLGKKYETAIFSDKFEDEGSTAFVIDGNFGFYCRMKGDEFGQHNQRGVMVVRGVLAQSNGRIGLDNCFFVSNDSGWKPD